MSERPIVYLDTETDSLRWDRRPWEIALIRRGPAGEVTAVIQVSDFDPATAEPEALAIGGYFNRHFGALGFPPDHDDPDITYLTERDAAELVWDMTDGATLVGANTAFDAHLLEMMLARHGLTPTWHYRLRDVGSMTAGYLRRDPGSLVNCARELGVEFPPETVHTALGDATAVMRIWDLIMGKPS